MTQLRPDEPLQARPRKPRGASSDALGEVIIETFICQQCGKDFDRDAREEARAL